MERKKENETRISWFIKSLLAAYAVSCVMLFGLSFLLYKFDLSEQTVQIGIILTYILSAFVGGFFIGKKAKVRRFLWGMTVGILYFFFLACISFGVYRSSFQGMEWLLAFLFCMAGGVAGGMMS